MRIVALAILLPALSGCSDPGGVVGFNEDDPAARMRAVRKAAQERDQDAIKPLIQRLESDDPAERLVAIRTLERLTGQTLGYDHAASRVERAAAVQRWTDWYAERHQPPPQNADG